MTRRTPWPQLLVLLLLLPLAGGQTGATAELEDRSVVERADDELLNASRTYFRLVQEEVEEDFQALKAQELRRQMEAYVAGFLEVRDRGGLNATEAATLTFLHDWVDALDLVRVTIETAERARVICANGLQNTPESRLLLQEGFSAANRVAQIEALFVRLAESAPQRTQAAYQELAVWIHFYNDAVLEALNCFEVTADQLGVELERSDLAVFPTTWFPGERVTILASGDGTTLTLPFETLDVTGAVRLDRIVPLLLPGDEEVRLTSDARTLRVAITVVRAESQILFDGVGLRLGTPAPEAGWAATPIQVAQPTQNPSSYDLPAPGGVLADASTTFTATFPGTPYVEPATRSRIVEEIESIQARLQFQPPPPPTSRTFEETISLEQFLEAFGWDDLEEAIPWFAAILVLLVAITIVARRLLRRRPGSSARDLGPIRSFHDAWNRLLARNEIDPGTTFREFAMARGATPALLDRFDAYRYDEARGSLARRFLHQLKAFLARMGAQP